MTFSEAFSPARAIAHGIEGLKRQPLGILLGGFLMGITQGGSSGGGPSDFGGENGDVEMSPEAALALLAAFAVVIGVVVVFGVIGFLVRSWIHTGWIRLHRDLVVDGQAEVVTLFRGFDAFGRMAGWKVLSTLVALGTFVASLLPGGVLAAVAWSADQRDLAIGGGLLLGALVALPASIYVALGLALGAHAVALEGKGPVAALERSWELADGNRLTLLVYYFVTGLFTLLGILLCCIGVWWTKAIVDVGTTEAFLLATRDDADTFAFSKLGA
ncbi:MAG: hypothetical protein ACOZNI_01765 [Myxococcota bacterium]